MRSSHLESEAVEVDDVGGGAEVVDDHLDSGRVLRHVDDGGPVGPALALGVQEWGTGHAEAVPAVLQVHVPASESREEGVGVTVS